MPQTMKLDAEFFVREVKNRVNMLLAQVADSFGEEGDKGDITIKIKLEQADDQGNISAHVEVNSKNAKFNSLSYECHRTGNALESGQIAMTPEELGEKAS